MGVECRELLERAEELIKSYNPKRTTLESHANESLAGIKLKSDAAFLKEVLYGVIRCKAALKVFMACFFNDMSARVLRSDYTMYMIFTYLSVFRLRELTIPEFQKFILSVDPDKMVNFLEYAFDTTTLKNSGVVTHWAKIFDPDYVHNTLLKELARASPDIMKIVSGLQNKSMGRIAAKEACKERCSLDGVFLVQQRDPNIPNLTGPAPRKVPEPQTIGQAVSCTEFIIKGGPKGPKPKRAREDESLSCGMRAIQETRTERVPITLHTTRSSLPMARVAVEKDRANGMSFSRLKSSKGVNKKSKATVRLNASTILREDALFRSKQEQEAERINAYEAELRDSGDFNLWQMNMRAQDQKTRLEQIARTRALAKASAEEAQQAKLYRLFDNRLIAERGVEEGRAMQQQRALEDEKTLVEKRQLVTKVKLKRELAPHRAVESMLLEKRMVRENLQQNMQERLNRQQMHKKKHARALSEHVKQLKAEHSIHRERQTRFDPTDTVGLGLLDEMSLVEMQERLAKNRNRETERQANKHSELLVAKKDEQERLIKRVENIKKVRENAVLKHQARRSQIHQASVKETKKYGDDNLLLELVASLENKRRAAIDQRFGLRLEEERAIKDKLFAGVGEQLKEKQAQTELLKGAERMAKTNQRDNLESLAKYDAAKLRYQHQKDHNRLLKQATLRKANARKEKLVEVASRETMKLQKEEIAGKQREYYSLKHEHREKMRTILDPFTERMNKLSVTRARKHVAGKL